MAAPKGNKYAKGRKNAPPGHRGGAEPGRLKGNKNAVGNRGGGRPFIYQSDFPRLAEEYIMLHGPHTTTLMIAERFGVSEQTVFAWMNKYPEFRRAIDLRKSMDGRVAKSMYRAAAGYRHRSEEIHVDPKSVCPACEGKRFTDETKQTKCRDCNGSGRLVIRVPTIKKYPPNVRAAQTVLQRATKGWVPKKSIEFEGADGKPITVDLSSTDVNELDDETLKQIAELIEGSLRRKKVRIKKGSGGTDE